MTVFVNQKSIEVPEACSVEQLLEVLQLSPKGIAIALGAQVLPRTSWSQTLSEGQSITIIKATQGG